MYNYGSRSLTLSTSVPRYEPHNSHTMSFVPLLMVECLNSIPQNTRNEKRKIWLDRCCIHFSFFFRLPSHDDLTRLVVISNILHISIFIAHSLHHHILESESFIVVVWKRDQQTHAHKRNLNGIQSGIDWRLNRECISAFTCHLCVLWFVCVSHSPICPDHHCFSPIILLNHCQCTNYKF